MDRIAELGKVESLMDDATRQVGASWQWLGSPADYQQHVPLAWADVEVTDRFGHVQVTTPADFLGSE